MLLDIRTVKHSTIYGADAPWSNQWRVSAPFDVSDPLTHDLAVYIVELELQIHCNHVLYDYVSIVKANDPGDASPNSGLVTVTHGGAVAGFQPTPALPSTAKEALYVQKYPQYGRLGRWFFFGCLDQADYRPSPRHHTRLVTLDPYNGVLSTWLNGLATNFGAVLTVPQGIFHGGISYADPTVIALAAGGLSLMNAATRMQTKHQGAGLPIWQGLRDKAREYALWYDQLNEWIAFNHDFIPQDAKDNTVTILGDLKALANSIKNYCSGPDNGDGTHGAAPAFRWPPSADELLTIADNMIDSIPKDIDDINQLNPYVFVDGQSYMTNGDTQTIRDKLTKYGSNLAEFVPADWRNPHQAPTG